GKELACRAGQVVERLLHRRVLDRVQLETAERGVQREQQRAAALPDRAFVAAARIGAAAGGLGCCRHRAASRSALFTASRTMSSLSSAALSRTCRASGVPFRDSATTASARVSGCSFRRSRPRGLRHAPSAAIPAAPAIDPWTSQTAIVSVRSSALSDSPLTTASTRLRAPLYP